MKAIYVSLAAIAGIFTLEIVALLNQVDGVLLSIAMAAIAGIAGYTIPKRAKKG